ncbi:MAG: hypothetical protein AAGI91_17510 [Bacteroidota bacterium]
MIVGHRPDLLAHLDAAGNALQLAVLEGLRHTVRRLRLLGLSDDVLGASKRARDQPAHVGRLQEAVLRVQRRYPTSEGVYEAASVRQTFSRAMTHPSAPRSLPVAAVRVLDRLCERGPRGAPVTVTALDVLDAIGADAPLSVAEVLDVLLAHELVSPAGDASGRPVYVVHPEARPF